MAYSKQTWENLPNQTTPITAERLNHMEDGIYEAYEHGGGGETLPVGSEIDFDGTSADIPTGWEETTDPESYSTDEVKTNKTWINGKPIYRKVVEFGNFPSGGSKTVATGITDLARIISLEYTWYDSSDGAYFTDARVDSATVMCKIQFKVNDNSLNVEGLGGTYWSSRTSQGVAIIEYTKTTD